MAAVWLNNFVNSWVRRAIIYINDFMTKNFCTNDFINWYIVGFWFDSEQIKQQFKLNCGQIKSLAVFNIFLWLLAIFCGPGSSVGIATGYGLDGPGIESRWGQDFPHLSRPVLEPTQPPVQWVPGLSPGVKSGQGVTLTPHPLLVPLVEV